MSAKKYHMEQEQPGAASAEKPLDESPEFGGGNRAVPVFDEVEPAPPAPIIEEGVDTSASLIITMPDPPSARTRTTCVGNCCCWDH